jgi:hypothetical protein
MKTKPNWQPIEKLRKGMLAVWQDTSGEHHLGGKLAKAKESGVRFFEFELEYPHNYPLAVSRPIDWVPESTMS